jgi:7,8-dihydropterin-6-yl-methyl-4-(beta-D-ribofuranosyl)aminobenzene 5'-phosphate synthase
MNIRITTLSENTANVGFIGEWGLSILVEADGLKILFDTGQSFSVTHNARALNIDLSKIDKVLLSHGHFDHTGGLREVLKQTGEMDIIAHPDALNPKLADHEGTEMSIGFPFDRKELEDMGARFNLTREPVWITENIVTTGEIPMVTDYEQVDPGMFIKDNGSQRPDPLIDDLAMAIRAEFGLTIILGCAHRGMINIIHRLQEITGEERVYCVVGGTHLLRATEERLAKTVADLRKTGIQRLGVSHCTGFNASCRLASEFPDIFFLNNAGVTIVLP